VAIDEEENPRGLKGRGKADHMVEGGGVSAPQIEKGRETIEGERLSYHLILMKKKVVQFQVGEREEGEKSKKLKAYDVR